MKTKVVGTIYLSEQEFESAMSVDASNDSWLPSGLNTLADSFVGYSGYSQDNMLAMSESMSQAVSQGKKAYIYEFNVVSSRSEIYVTEEALPMVDSIDLGRCDKVILESIYKLAVEKGYNDVKKAKIQRGGRDTIDNNLLYCFLAANPIVMRIAKEIGLMPKLRNFRLPYGVLGKAYVMLYIIDPSCIETTNHGICYITIKVIKRVVLMFPMFEGSPSLSNT
jgi:hypothetical protein